jgi:predicted DNA-binding protein YlxM (UPF0122 family)
VELTKEVLEELYIAKKWSKEKIRKHFGISRQMITKCLDDFNIEQKPYKNLKITKEDLEELYIRQNMPHIQIAELYGVSRRTVGDACKKFGLEKEDKAIADNRAATHLRRYGITHLHKDKEFMKKITEKRIATVKGEDWGKDKINELLRIEGRQLEMIGEFTTVATKTLFCCLKDGCECKWMVYPSQILNGHNCPRCTNREKYTQERFDAFLAKYHPNTIRIGEFKDITTPTSFCCTICGYGKDGTWFKCPNNFTAKRKHRKNRHICPRCNGQEKYTHESFVAKLAETNPNLRVIGEYKGHDNPVELECLLCGHMWINNAPSSVIMSIKHRTSCPACRKYKNNINGKDIVYDSSWEVLFHIDNPHLERNTEYHLTYTYRDQKHQWTPDFYDPETGLLYEIKPNIDPYGTTPLNNGRTDAKKALGANVIWIGNAEIEEIRQRHSDFNPGDFRNDCSKKLMSIEDWKRDFLSLFPIKYEEPCVGRLYFPDYKLAIHFDVSYHLARRTRRNRYESCKKRGIRLIQIWEYEWLNEINKRRLIEYLKKIFYPGKNVVLMARKLKIRLLYQHEFMKFANAHHLLGSCHVKYCVGAFYDDELVAAHGYRQRGGVWELCRYVCGSYVIPGISNRLFKRFCLDCKPMQVKSYVDLDKFEGDADKAIGMIFDYDSCPTMLWVNTLTNERLDRFSARGRYMKNMIHADYVQWMLENHWIRIYDTGKRKMVWRRCD